MKAKVKTSITRIPLTLLTALFLSLGLALLVQALPRLEKTEYEGNGKVSVEFTHDVKFKNLKVTVKDEEGKSLAATIVEQDEDEVTFRVNPSSLTAGKTYAFTLKGVASQGETTYTSLTGSFTVPASSKGLTLKEIEIDFEDKEVTFEFKEKLQYKKLTVSITRGKTEYVKKIKEKDARDIEVKLRKKLKKGKTYQYKITGLRKKGDSTYTSVTGSFVA